jgi:hypothetical protein
MSIRGKAGETRAYFGASGTRDDYAQLSLSDRKGTQRLSLSELEEKTFLFLTDVKHKLRAAIGLAPGSPAGMSLLDPVEKRANLELTEDDQGTPALKLNDLKGNRTKIFD